MVAFVVCGGEVGEEGWEEGDRVDVDFDFSLEGRAE